MSKERWERAYYFSFPNDQVLRESVRRWPWRLTDSMQPLTFKQHMNSSVVTAQAEPPLSSGNLGMAVSTKPQQAKAQPPAGCHPWHVVASTLCTSALCQQVPLLDGGQGLGETKDCSHQATACELWVEPMNHLSTGPGKACIKVA